MADRLGCVMLHHSLSISNIWKIKYTKRKSFAKDAPTADFKDRLCNTTI